MTRRLPDEPLVLVLDIGTSSVRGAIYDRHALPRTPTVRAESVWQVDQSGRAELSAALLERSVRSVVDRTVSRVRQPVAAIAVSTFWHSLLGLDRSGAPCTPVLAWTDTRSHRQAAALRAAHDESAVHARTGCVFHSSYWPAKLVWFRETQPTVFRRVRSWVSVGEYLERLWFGRGAVSLSTASGTGLFDQQDCRWDSELLDLCRVGPDQLGALVDLDEPVGGLTPSLRRRWPSLTEAQWLPPAGDGAMSNVGSGCSARDRIAINVGTSGAMRVMWAPASTKRIPVPAGLWRYRLDRRRIVIGGALSNGGNVVAWLLRTLRTDTLPTLERALQKMSPDAHGLTMLPFLAGERSPDWTPAARGTVTGLSLATRPLDVVRAALEAVAYRFALIDEQLDAVAEKPRSLVASGGGLVHSRVWSQILSDVLNRPIAVSAVGEASSRGAALVALAVLAVIPDIDAIRAPVARIIRPDPRRHERYMNGLARHRRLDDLLAVQCRTQNAEGRTLGEPSSNPRMR